MDILGIGPLELFFIMLIALIVLGPNDIVKTGRTIGRFLRKLVTSPTWHTMQDATREIRRLPNRLMREAGLEEIKEELEPQKIKKDLGLDQIQGEAKALQHDLSELEPQKIKKDLGLDQIQREARELQHDLSEWTTPPDPGQKSSPPASPAPLVETPAESSAPGEETKSETTHT